MAGDGGRSTWRTRPPRRPWPTVGLPRAEQVDAARRRRARRPSRLGARSRRSSARELLHEVAARLRARTDELARVMTREGGKPLVENSDEVGWTAAAFDYYAEMGRNFAGRVIPPIESTQLALVLKEPIGVVACIVPWNYPLLLLAWKLAPALAAGNTVVCKPSELTPLSTLMLAPCFEHLPPGAFNVLAGRRRRGRGDRRRRARRLRRVHRLGRDRQEDRGALRRARRARSTSRWAARTRSSSAPTSPAEIEVAARGGAWAAYLNAGPGLHVGGALLRRARGLRRLRVRVRRPHALAARRRPARRRRPTSGRWSRRRSARRSRRRSRRRWRPGAELVVGGDRAGQRARPLLRARRGHRRAGRDRPAARGDVRPVAPIVPVRLARRGDRARQRHALRARRQRLHARPRDRASAACARSRPARSGSTTR